MSSIGFSSDFVQSASAKGHSSAVIVYEIAGGYAIRSECRPRIEMRLMQGFSLAAGVVALALAVALIGFSGAMSGPLAAGVAVILVALAVLLLDFSRQQQHWKIEIDLAGRELREMKGRRNGQFKLRARIGFDKVSGIFIDDRPGRSALVLRLGQASEILPVATGSRAALAPLATRLGRDLFGPGV